MNRTNRNLNKKVVAGKSNDLFIWLNIFNLKWLLAQTINYKPKLNCH